MTANLIVINDKNEYILSEIEKFVIDNELNIVRILDKPQGIISQIKTVNGDVVFGCSYEKGWFYRVNEIEIKYEELEKIKCKILLYVNISEEKTLIKYQGKLRNLGCEVLRKDGKGCVEFFVYYRHNIQFGSFGYYYKNNEVKYFKISPTSINNKREPVDCLEDFINKIESQVIEMNANIDKYRTHH